MEFPDSALSPIHEALGHAVVALAGVEVWVYMQLSSFTEETFDAVEKRGPAQAIKDLETWTDRFPEGDERLLFEALLATTRRLLDERNSLCHGIWWSNGDHTLLQSQRPPRTPKGQPVEYLTDPDGSVVVDHQGNKVPKWVKRTFSRGDLIVLAWIHR